MRRDLLICVAGLLGAAVCAAETISTIDGRRLAGKLVAIDGSHVTVRTTKGTQKLPLADAASIVHETRQAEDLMSRLGRHVAVAEDGSRLAVAEVAIRRGKLTAVIPSIAAGRVSLPVEAFARLLRPRAGESPGQLERRAAKLHLTRGDKDILVVGKTAGQWAPVWGILEGLDKGKVRFSYDGTSTEMDASAVVLIEMAKLGERKRPRAAGQLLMLDGSRLNFASLSLTAKGARAVSASLGTLKVDPAKIAGVYFRSERLVPLSELKPVSVRQTPFFDESFGHRLNCSVTGGPLRMSGRTYPNGLGLHARCELTYDLSGRYQRFSAIAGIDDSVRSGAADLTIFLDGKALVGKLRLDRTKGAEAIRLNVKGGKKLTVLVDFAADTFGSGARVDLCDAVLSK